MVVGIIIAVVVVLLVLFVIVTYNGLVRTRNRIDNAYSQIDVQLKRRHDLIPNLVETVKGYAAHEKGAFEAVTQARANAINAQSASPPGQAQAENQLRGALKSLFAVAEAYPDLKANQNFLNLQEELTSTEDRIAYSRQFYNDSVLGYNNRIQSFPGNMIAGMFNFPPREYFEGDPEASRARSRSSSRARRVHQGTVMGMYEQIARNKRRTFVMLAVFVLLIALVAVALGYPLPGRCRDRADRDRDRDRDGVDVVLLLRQDRARREPGEAGRRSGVPPATTTSSRGCASPRGCPKPRLYVVDDPAPNAFATGRNPKHAALAVTTGLLEKMNRVELEGVLAHELSHVKNYDILVSTVAVTAVGAVALMADLGLRFMWFGGRSGPPGQQRLGGPSALILVDPRVRAADPRPVRRPAHAVRDEPPARAARRRLRRPAHPLPARADLGAREAAGRPGGRAPRHPGHRADVDRAAARPRPGAERHGGRRRARGSTARSTPIRRSRSGSPPSRPCEPDPPGGGDRRR